MLQDSVQQCSGKNRISHHLCPVRNLLVGGKDQGRRLVGITDKGKEPVRLGPGDRSVADFIAYNQLSLLQVLNPEAGSPVRLTVVEKLNQVPSAWLSACNARTYT